MRFLWLASVAISTLACAASPSSASALELIGQAGILGEWELTANLEAAGGRLHQAKMSIGDYGNIALAFDTEGNMFGLHSMG